MPQKEAELNTIQKQSEEPDLWQDPENAQRVMKKLAALRDEVESARSIRQRIDDTLELAQLEDESLRGDLEKEVASIEKEVSQREFLAMFSGK